MSRCYVVMEVEEAEQDFPHQGLLQCGLAYMFEVECPVAML